MFTIFKKKQIEVFSPLKGTFVPIEKVQDEVFSKKVLGDGFAIMPTSRTVLSPVDGEIKMIFPTHHALGISTKEGIEMMIHIGIDTVNENGEGFQNHVHIDQTVKSGEPLISFNLDGLREKGYDMTTMVIITGSNSFDMINMIKEQEVDTNTVVCILEKK